MKANHHFDVAILGAGIGGSLLAAILARHGVRVLLIEQGSHPRFAIGESTIPETTILLRLMARRYDVPEIEHLSNFQKIRAHVSPGCGVKRNFSFVYHRNGAQQDPTEITQFPTWAPPFGPDVHFFRQDVDAYMFMVAASYGAECRQQTVVKDIAFDANSVALTTNDNKTFIAKYVIDAGGIRAAIAQMHNLRETPCPLKTQSWTLFTHMIGVAPFDTCGPQRRAHGMPSPFSQGTLHHIFKGGWMWVIPFDNHPSATNPLVSVGLTLNLDHYPEGKGAPEEEFRDIISHFPAIATQFEGARAIRPWTTSGRLQYWSSSVVGERFCLIPHAAAFVDPLFSSGLAITMSTINVLADELIHAVRDDDFSRPRFAYIDSWVKRCFQYYDDLVAGSYTSFDNFELWNAWHRIWMLGSLYGVSGLFEVLGRYELSGDASQFNLLREPPYSGVQGIDFAPCAALFKAAVVEMDRYRMGLSSAADTAQALYRLIGESGIAPSAWSLLDPTDRCPAKTFTFLPMLRLVAWGQYQSPQVVRRHYFTAGRAKGFIAAVAGGILEEASRLRHTAFAYLRDTIFSWNRDWRRGNAALLRRSSRRAQAPMSAATVERPSP